jgi:hypothetical protein
MKKLSVIGVIIAAVLALAAPAQADPCDKDIHIHTGVGVHVCRDYPDPGKG